LGEITQGPAIKVTERARGGRFHTGGRIRNVLRENKKREGGKNGEGKGKKITAPKGSLKEGGTVRDEAYAGKPGNETGPRGGKEEEINWLGNKREWWKSSEVVLKNVSHQTGGSRGSTHQTGTFSRSPKELVEKKEVKTFQKDKREGNRKTRTKDFWAEMVGQ